MSVFKQLEQAKLTPEEIRELITLLDTVLPKIKRQVDAKIRSSTLGKNLRDKLPKNGTIHIPDDLGDDASDLEKGYKLLESVNTKLITFKELIEEC